MTKDDFPFTLDFRGSCGNRTFASCDDLLQWLEEQSDCYKPFVVKPPQSSDNLLRALFERIHRIVAVRETLKSAMEKGDQEDFLRKIVGVRNSIRDIFYEGALPPANSVEVQALRPHAEQDPVAAVCALHCLLDEWRHQGSSSLLISEPAIARGIGLAAFVRFQLSGQHPQGPQIQVIDRAVAALGKTTDDARTKLKEHQEIIDQLESKSKHVLETARGEFNKISEKINDDVGKEIAAAKASIESFKSAYQAEIALKEPVTFWTKKSRSHLWGSIWFGIAALSVGTFAAFQAMQHLPTLLVVSKDTPPPYYGIALAVSVSTLIIWLLRVLVRNYLAQSHLKADADERVAMVKTYLALSESGKAPAESLGPVLAALFRPASDGLVKDDSMPMNIAELLTKVGK
jgi:hypothetical protein